MWWSSLSLANKVVALLYNMFSGIGRLAKRISYLGSFSKDWRRCQGSYKPLTFIVFLLNSHVYHLSSEFIRVYVCECILTQHLSSILSLQPLKLIPKNTPNIHRCKLTRLPNHSSVSLLLICIIHALIAQKKYLMTTALGKVHLAHSLTGW